jgi:magnesium transporter
VAARKNAVNTTGRRATPAGGAPVAGASPAVSPGAAADAGPAHPPTRGAAEASTPSAAHARPTPAAGAPIATATAMAPRIFWRAPDGSVRRDVSLAELCRIVASGDGMLWVDIDSQVRTQHALLEKVFAFHPLSIEDTLNPVSRVKLEEYPGYLFMIVRSVGFCEATQDPYDLDTANLCFFLGRNFLVTVHGGRAPAVESLIERLERSPDFLTRGPAWLMYVVADGAVDAFFPILDRLDDFLDGIEERVFTSFDDAALQEIFSVKRLVLSLRRHLVPQREIFNVLTNRPSALLTTEAQLYYRDIYDHVLRINDTLDMYRDLLSSTMDSYLSQVSNRVGNVTKGLSLIATLSIPFVMVSGMWGMNFGRIPLSSHPYGFAILLVLQVAMAIGLVALLRWRRFL